MNANISVAPEHYLRLFAFMRGQSGSLWRFVRSAQHAAFTKQEKKECKTPRCVVRDKKRPRLPAAFRFYNSRRMRYTRLGILMIFFWMAYCTSCALL